eukprot:1547976-Pleurochrysis_carterae.AAC.5
MCDSVGVWRDFVPLISHNQRARLIRLINKNNWKEARQKLEKWSATATADAVHQLELLRKLGLPSTVPPVAAEQCRPSVLSFVVYKKPRAFNVTLSSYLTLSPRAHIKIDEEHYQALWWMRSFRFFCLERPPFPLRWLRVRLHLSHPSKAHRQPESPRRPPPPMVSKHLRALRCPHPCVQPLRLRTLWNRFYPMSTLPHIGTGSNLYQRCLVGAAPSGTASAADPSILLCTRNRTLGACSSRQVSKYFFKH